ncbi:MAG: aminopeptidase P family protein [Candidatus Eisenbacteria bacterium]
MTSYLDVRRQRAADAWNLSDEIVLVGAGEPLGIPGGADQTYPFVSHSDYFYLADRETIGGVLAFDPKAGWVDFVPEATEAERVWEGRTDSPGTSILQLTGWLAARRGRTVAMLGVPLPGVRADLLRSEDLRDALLHVRRPKDAVELERMRRAATASAAGYTAIESLIRTGASEREIQIELEAAFFRNGAERPAYGTIVAAGSNSAVLHFTPTTRRLRDGEVLLIDAGAEVSRYASDVTRTWRTESGAGKPVTDEGFFRELYQVVLGILERGVARCVVGAEWRDVHLAACLEVAEGLAALGLLRGTAADLVDRDAHALFFPHGLGHMVGLGVRDAGGYLKGRARSTRPGLKNLRTDLPLEAGYTITVEPGIYFIAALLNDPARREQYRDAVNWAQVEALMEFGGIRLEDNVHVTTDGPENLNAVIPRNLAPVR